MLHYAPGTPAPSEKIGERERTVREALRALEIGGTLLLVEPANALNDEGAALLQGALGKLGAEVKIAGYLTDGEENGFRAFVLAATKVAEASAAPCEPNEFMLNTEASIVSIKGRRKDGKKPPAIYNETHFKVLAYYFERLDGKLLPLDGIMQEAAKPDSGIAGKFGGKQKASAANLGRFFAWAEDIAVALDGADSEAALALMGRLADYQKYFIDVGSSKPNLEIGKRYVEMLDEMVDVIDALSKHGALDESAAFDELLKFDRLLSKSYVVADRDARLHKHEAVVARQLDALIEMERTNPKLAEAELERLAIADVLERKRIAERMMRKQKNGWGSEATV
jgi:hypothetical protein